MSGRRDELEALDRAARCDAAAGNDVALHAGPSSRPSSDAFLTAPGAFVDARRASADRGRRPAARPALSTTGGTSDARFIKDICPVVEFGLVGQTMHQVDERVAVADLESLTRIYERILAQYFAGSARVKRPASALAASLPIAERCR